MTLTWAWLAKPAAASRMIERVGVLRVSGGLTTVTVEWRMSATGAASPLLARHAPKPKLPFPCSCSLFPKFVSERAEVCHEPGKRGISRNLLKYADVKASQRRARLSRSQYFGRPKAKLSARRSLTLLRKGDVGTIALGKCHRAGRQSPPM